MIEISNFTIKSIIEFINSLRLIIIPNTNISLLGFYISLIALSIIFTFIRRFFRIEKNLLNTKINASYFNIRKNLKKKAGH